MASQDDDCSSSRQTRGEPHHASKTSGDRGAKLLADAQRAAKATSKQTPGRLILKGEDSQDITIKCLHTQLVELTQILIDNKLIKPPQIDEG